MIQDMLGQLTVWIQKAIWFSPLLAFAAGLLTSMMPCSLSSLSLILGYVTGEGSSDTKRSCLLSITFALGSGLTFTAFGIGASLLGKMIGHLEILHVALSIFMIVMAFQIWGVIHVIPDIHSSMDHPKSGYAGAFFTGVVGGFFASHCAVPVIISLLAIAASQQSVLLGFVMLLSYSVGHGILAVAAGTSTGFAQRIGEEATKGSRIFHMILGLFVFAIGIVSLLAE